MIDYFIVFFYLMMAHAITDFGLQTVALGKGKYPLVPRKCLTDCERYQHKAGRLYGLHWPIWLIMHALICAAGVIVVGEFFHQKMNMVVPFLALVEFVLHFVIDYLKTIGKYGANSDQYFHMLCRVAYAIIIVRA